MMESQWRKERSLDWKFLGCHPNKAFTIELSPTIILNLDGYQYLKRSYDISLTQYFILYAILALQENNDVYKVILDERTKSFDIPQESIALWLRLSNSTLSHHWNKLFKRNVLIHEKRGEAINYSLARILALKISNPKSISLKIDLIKKREIENYIGEVITNEKFVVMLLLFRQIEVENNRKINISQISKTLLLDRQTISLTKDILLKAHLLNYQYKKYFFASHIISVFKE